MPTDSHPALLVNRLLSGAYVPPGHDPADQPSAAIRITRAAGRAQLAQQPTDEALRADGEQFERELNLCSTLILGDAKASAVLNLLMTREPEPEGALVFGCLLHLTGRGGGARFWWRFAAGADVDLGAYCLYLHHAHAGEFDAARHWYAQWHMLRDKPAERANRAAPQGPLLPDSVYRGLLTQCHSGQRPTLPLAMEVAVNQIQPHDPYFDDVPQPSAALPAVLASPA